MRGKSSERNRVKEREGIRFVSVCVFVCLYEGGGSNLRGGMGALRVLSTPFNSSRS